MIIDNIEVNDDSVFFTGILSGDLYFAKRNTGWKLLECKEYNKEENLVFPLNPLEYVFDSWECYKVL